MHGSLRGRVGGAAVWLVLGLAVPEFGPPAHAVTDGAAAVPVWHTPGVEAARAEADSTDKEQPPRVGVPFEAGLTPLDHGAWTDLPDGSRLWTLGVESPEALWIVLGFDRFDLPPGAVLRVEQAGGGTVHGPYTSKDVRGHGALWVPPVPGSALRLRLHWPAALRGQRPALRLATVSHGFRDLAGLVARSAGQSVADARAGSGSCNVDINCPLGQPWQDAKRGVVLLLIDGSLACTGSLINSASGECRPYVLTAQHCGITEGNAQTTIFVFGKEREGCGTGSSAVPVTASGAMLRAASSLTDFALIEMDNPPPAQAAAFLNGWSRLAAPPAQAWTIHHPQADLKKISHDADGPVTGPSGGYGPSFWRVNQWEQGTTEPGSSGGPLFDADQRIIGQLRGGIASCSVPGWDEFGKLDESWDRIADSRFRLSDWLDPSGSGVLAVDGVDHAACLGARCSSDVDCVDGVDCTVDRCEAGTCRHLGNDARCADADPCTRNLCDAGAGGCVALAESDGDGDLLCDVLDNCPADANADQADFDQDGAGDVCETGARLIDADLSGRVDGFDLAQLARAFGAWIGAGRYDAAVDYDQNGWVDGDDLARMPEQFGRGVP